MKVAAEWARELADHEIRQGVERLAGRAGEPTVRVDGTLLHSQYRPVEEAVRFIESADLEPNRPVLVVGLGLGYHVLVLAEQGFEVAAVEPDRSVGKLAVDGLLAHSDIPLGIGAAADVADNERFRAFGAKDPQILVHPPTARVSPQYVDEIRARVARCRLQDQRLGVAVVGPLYGGSLPIARYLADALKRLGHRALFVDNSQGWPLYEAVTDSVSSKRASGQLSGMIANVMSEWSYARVREFDPNVCIVLAQAPVGNTWAERLRKHDIVTAFWFVENWRHMTYWQDIATQYDYFFHIQPGEFEQKLSETGCRRHAYVQTGCDPEVHRPVTLSDADRKAYGCDLSFAGAGYHNRNHLFAGLTDYDFKIWGVEWHARELQLLVQDPDERFGPEQFAKIVAGSKINLNLHSSATHDSVDPRCDAINPRVFEIAACGGFQLCDPCQGLESLFDPNSEIPTYRGLAELREKVDYYLAHPEKREVIASAARKKALSAHTYEHRAKQMLDYILSHYADRIARKGVRAQRTVGEVAAKVPEDDELCAYLRSLPAETPFTQDTINARIPLTGTPLSYPEGVFAYLREMRKSAEQLLAMFDDA